MAGIAAAQASDAEITGLAKDPAGAQIPSANVTLVNQDSGFTRTVTTDADGRYRFVALPPGTYTIKVEATGFKTRNGHRHRAAHWHARRSRCLAHLGSLQETVTVTGEVPPVDTTRGDVSGVVTNQQIDTLPVNTRQYLNLALLMPRYDTGCFADFLQQRRDRRRRTILCQTGSPSTSHQYLGRAGRASSEFSGGRRAGVQRSTSTSSRAEQGLAMGGMVTVVTRAVPTNFPWRCLRVLPPAGFESRKQISNCRRRKRPGLEKLHSCATQWGGRHRRSDHQEPTAFYTAFERTQTDQSFTIFTGAAGHQFYSAIEGVFSQPLRDQMLNVRADYQISSNQHLFGAGHRNGIC